MFTDFFTTARKSFHRHATKSRRPRHLAFESLGQREMLTTGLAGTLVISPGTPGISAPATPVASQLASNTSLQPGHSISSPNGRFKLYMQLDGNLVLYAPSGAIWSSGTCGKAGTSASMQRDGNLVLYRNGRAVWASNTAGHTGAYLALQNDGNLVIYQNSKALWASNTAGAGNWAPVPSVLAGQLCI